ncbi:WYL domain-containing protein [Corallincola platygyrae]|uniref:WYL domain-containing protein n=1 Tax=Corallincola platygyrae TaxID=1193278 RepID=A0ABW4XIQ3_9GAMM
MELAQLNHAQRERLAFIDFNLNYFGQVARADLIQRFHTGLASATRDFSVYRELAPENLALNHKVKSYIRKEGFKPLFDHDPESVLAGLARGFGDGLSHLIEPSEVCFDAMRLVHPNTKVISGLMRAISQEKPLKCRYVSISSGELSRVIVPHSIVNNGHRWHVRAFDRKKSDFRDFICTRFKSLSLLDEKICANETRKSDKHWNRIVDIQLVPHPSLAHSEAIALDYGMDDGVLCLEVRAALVGYLLRQWNVDCSERSTLNTQGCQLALKNIGALYGVTNLELAPGYSSDQTVAFKGEFNHG